jgi:uncharacterized protein (TIGR04222 family)
VRGRIRGSLLALGAVVGVLWGAGPALAQGIETIHAYEVRIEISGTGDLLITERIDYDFGSARRHGIFRTIPSRFYADDVRDRVYRIEDVSVESPTAPTDVEVSAEGGSTTIRIGDPDVEISGRHRYTITYRVEGALNAFPDHDELYWNAIGTEWEVAIDGATATVEAPGGIQRVTCYVGYEGSTEACGSGEATGPTARFAAGRPLAPSEGLTVVVAMPKGAVPEPRPIYEERWSAARAFRVTPATVAATTAVAAIAVTLIGAVWWRSGRDRRYVGSPVDQVLGTRSGEDETIPWGEGDAEAPVEFSPPDRLHPADMGVLLDERPRTLHVTATIVDLAVRGFLTIEEIEKRGLFGKPDWILRRASEPGDELPRYERLLLESLFRKGDEVTVSELRDTFATRLQRVKRALIEGAVSRKWFVESPEKVRLRWTVRGTLAIVAGVGATVALALWTRWALVGPALILAGVLLLLVGRAMPARTARGTALVRRIRGFRRVIATAETHQARWAEREGVFTRYLPYAIVFGLTEKWAKAFADMGLVDEAPRWYVGPHAFTYAAFADSIDSFAVATGGTLASTPASSGTSGFSGGGFSGGGGGGGGGGSW